ncbi:MAG: hypothetical protein R8M38_04625 [Mariprofundaceae bacterium]
MKRGILLGVTAIMLTLSTAASALPNYPSVFSTQYPNANVISCDYCHDGAVKVFTQYGLTLKGQNALGQNVNRNDDIVSRFSAAEPLDSDVDKFTNLQEINANSDPSIDTSKPVAGDINATLNGATSSFSIASISEGATISAVAAKAASANDILLTDGRSFLGALNAEFSITGADGLSSQVITLLFSDSAVPLEGTVLHYISDTGVSTPLQQSVDWEFNQIGGVDITLMDGGDFDLDAVVDGTIVSRIAVEHIAISDNISSGTIQSGPKGGLCIIDSYDIRAFVTFLFLSLLAGTLRKKRQNLLKMENKE